MNKIPVKDPLDESVLSADRGGMSMVRNRAIAARFREAQARLSEAEGRRVTDREIDRRAGLAGSHTSQILRGLEQGKTTTVDTFLDLAAAVEADPGWLLTGAGAGLRLGDLPGWAEVEADARARYRTIPDFAIAQVATFTMPRPPRLDVTFVGEVARAWFDAAGDDLRAAVETEYVKARHRQKMT